MSDNTEDFRIDLAGPITQEDFDRIYLGLSLVYFGVDGFYNEAKGACFFFITRTDEQEEK